MSPLVAYHTAPRRHRDSIEKHGLLPDLPSASNCFGVYVYRDDHTHRTMRTRGSTGVTRQFHLRWTRQRGHDLWQIAYIGPLSHDPFVENGLILYGAVTFASLVSQLSEVTP